MKPLSQKNITKKYIEANITDTESKLLHRYFLCFSYLYGCIEIKTLWNIFKQYGENIDKKKFYDFADIAQRETNDFSVFSLAEVYSGETSTRTDNKLLVNNSIFHYPREKFWNIKILNENVNYNNGPFVPRKEELFKFDHDLFYETNEGKEMFDFVSNLVTTGVETNKYNVHMTAMQDIDGNPVIGKRLKDFIYISHYEMLNIDYYKNDSEKYRKKYSVNSASKILALIKLNMMIRGIDELKWNLEFSVDMIVHEFGVNLSEDELRKYLDLYMQLFNSANRWSNFGWSGNELFKRRKPDNGPIDILIGENMQKMIKNGELNIDEFKKTCDQNDLRISFKDDADDCEKVMQENEKYIKVFEKYLEESNLKENGIDDHIDRVNCYLNHYLILGIAKTMEEGCSSEIIGFIENYVNEKVFPVNILNIDLFLNSISLFYKCMCANGLVSLNVYNELLSDIKECKDELIEDYYDKNPVDISIDQVVELIEMACGFGEGYMNIKTGKTILIPDDPTLCYSNEQLDELYEKIDGYHWEIVPKINDYRIMTGFVKSLKNQAQANKLFDILHSKKAYRKFKDAIYNMNIEEDYFDYRETEIIKMAEVWMKENDLIQDDYDDYYDEDLNEYDNVKH